MSGVGGQVASAAGHVEAVEALLDSKADIAAVGDNGETALMLACAQVKLAARLPLHGPASPARLTRLESASSRSQRVWRAARRGWPSGRRW